MHSGGAQSKQRTPCAPLELTSMGDYNEVVPEHSGNREKTGKTTGYQRYNAIDLIGM